MKKACNSAGVLIALAMTTAVLPLSAQPAPPTLLNAGAAGAAGAAARTDGPRIKFAETRFDFGKINSSTAVRHDFIVTNVGAAPLNITSVQPGCPGCTKAVSWDREIPPGQTGRIQIEFNPAGFSGTVSKSVTVNCNDAAQATHYLQFQATIWQPIEVTPAYVYFMPVDGESTNETKVVRIVNHLDEPVTLQPPRTDNPRFQLDLKTVQPGREFELRISHASPSTNTLPQGTISIATSSTNALVLKVSAVAMPQPALVVSPHQINVPFTPSGAGHRHTQLIRNNGSQALKLTEATVNAEGVVVQVSEQQPGKVFILNVNFPPGFKPGTGVPTALTVKTSSSRQPVITIPISQFAVPGSIGAPPAALPPAGLK